MSLVFVVPWSLTIRLSSESLALSRLGFEVDHAVNGLEGLEQSQQHALNVVLCDYWMPVMDDFGWSAAVSWLGRSPSTMLVPSIHFWHLCVCERVQGKASDYEIFEGAGKRKGTANWGGLLTIATPKPARKLSLSCRIDGFSNWGSDWQ